MPTTGTSRAIPGSFDVTGLGTLGNATLYATVQGNTISNSLGSGIRLNVNAGTPTLNAIVTGNTTACGSGGGNTFPGIGLRKQGTTSGQFNIVGLTPSPATNAQMEAYVGAQNPGSTSGTFGTGGAAAVNGSSSNWTAIASVPQPAALP